MEEPVGDLWGQRVGGMGPQGTLMVHLGEMVRNQFEDDNCGKD